MSNNFKDRFPLWDENWEKYSDFFDRFLVPAKTILLKDGEVAKKIFFIEKGCMRLWYNDNGKDISVQFFFEGQRVSSYESFRTNKPSKFNIETIESCVIHVISKMNFLTVLKDSPAIRVEIEENLFQRWIHYRNLFLSRIKDSPQKRYEEMLKENPLIIQRIPQHYIASYLGITPVSLSRIKNR